MSIIGVKHYRIGNLEYLKKRVVRMGYTYIVECKDGTLYTGWTTNIERRVCEHNNGKGAKYTRYRGPVVLRYFEEFGTKKEAMKRECEIKKLSRKDKIKLISKFERVLTNHK